MIASFLADNPAAAGSSDRELIAAIREMWPELDAEAIERAFGIARWLKEARSAARTTDLQALVERTRLFHGAQVAAELVSRHI